MKTSTQSTSWEHAQPELSKLKKRGGSGLRFFGDSRLPDPYYRFFSYLRTGRIKQLVIDEALSYGDFSPQEMVEHYLNKGLAYAQAIVKIGNNHFNNESVGLLLQDFYMFACAVNVQIEYAQNEKAKPIELIYEELIIWQDEEYTYYCNKCLKDIKETGKEIPQVFAHYVLDEAPDFTNRFVTEFTMRVATNAKEQFGFQHEPTAKEGRRQLKKPILQIATHYMRWCDENQKLLNQKTFHQLPGVSVQ